MRIPLLLLTVALAAADEPTREVRASFRALSLADPIEQAGYLKGRAAVQLTIPSDFFSAPQEYRGPPIITFFLSRKPEVRADARDPFRAELAKALAEAERLEARHAANAQAVAESVANAPEGPEGDALRRQAEEALALAAPEVEAARRARERAAELQRRIDTMNPEEQKPTKAEGKKAARPKSAPQDFTPLGSVAVADGESLMLLFVPDRGTQRILRLPDGPQSHPFGTLRFLNLGAAPLLLRSASSTRSAEPLKPVTFTPAPDEHGYVGLEIRAAGAEGRVLRTVRARPEPGARTTYLIFSEADAVTVKGVTERAAR